MSVRNIVKINEEKCNGCGLCIPNCAEGALQIIDGKAELVSDKYCDGLGACLGTCPMDAIEIIKREADDFDEQTVEQYLESKQNHDKEPKTGGCPGSRIVSLKERETADFEQQPEDIEVSIRPQLAQWPVQLKLVPVQAPYFNGTNLLVTADCVPFAYADYHLGLLKGKSVVVGCPKLDDNNYYTEKLTEIIKNNDIRKVTVAYMEVPCCGGIVRAVDTAIKNSGKDIPIALVEICIDGRIKGKIETK